MIRQGLVTAWQVQLSDLRRVMISILQQVGLSTLHRVRFSVLRPPPVVALGAAAPVTAGIASAQRKIWNSTSATAGLASSRRRQLQLRS